MTKKLIYLFLLTALVVPTQIFAISITGVINNAAGKTLYLERFEKNQPIRIDSAVINKKGKFTFKFEHASTEFYRMSFVPTDFIVLILSPNENAEINAEYALLNKSYSVKGSPESEKLLEFVKLVNNYVQLKDSLTTRMLAYRNNAKNDSAQLLNNMMATEYINFILNRNAFLDNNPKSAALVAVTNHLNLQNDAANELVHLKKIEAALNASMPNSFYYTSIHDMVVGVEAKLAEEEKQREFEKNKGKLLEPGREVTDFQLKDKDGNIIKLSSLRGKYVLIDYWASWCGPCRKENPNVVKMYNKYKDKGFTIYSISLDNNKDKWLDAIAKDGLIWPNHVSELTGWNCSALKEFNVTGIPFTALIDKEGKLVQTNLRGPALEMKLKELFGE